MQPCIRILNRYTLQSLKTMAKTNFDSCGGVQEANNY